MWIKIRLKKHGTTKNFLFLSRTKSNENEMVSGHMKDTKPEKYETSAGIIVGKTNKQEVFAGNRDSKFFYKTRNGSYNFMNCPTFLLDHQCYRKI